MIKKFSNWFDTLKEPKRFFTFISVVFGCYIPFLTALFLFSNTKEFIFLKIFLIILGFVQLFFLITLAIHRAITKD